MPSRTILVAVAAVGTIASSFAFDTGAHAAVLGPNAFPSLAPRIITANLGSPVNDRIDVTPAFSHLLITSNAGQTGGHARVFDVDTGATLCEADPTVADSQRPQFDCVISKVLPYGETEIAAVLTSPDGSVTTAVSDHLFADRTFSESTIALDAYDDESKTARVSGRSLRGESFTVTTTGIGGGTGTAPSTTTGTVGEDGLWSATISGVERPSSLRFRLDRFPWAGRTLTYVPAEGSLPTPTVTTEIGSSFVAVRVSGTDGNPVVVRDSDGLVVTAAGSSNENRNEAVAYFADPHVERRYTAGLSRDGQTSAPVPFVVHAGQGTSTPAAPHVEGISDASERVVATIGASPGAVVRIADAAGTVAAVRAVGGSGTVEVPFAAPRGRSNAVWSVTQTSEGATSSKTTFATATP